MSVVLLACGTVEDVYCFQGKKCSIDSECAVREVNELVGRCVATCFAVVAILCLAVHQESVRAEPVRSESGTSETTVRHDIEQRIAALKQRVPGLNAHVAEFSRDNKDLTARLQSRRQEVTGAPSPAVQGEPGVLSSMQGSRVAGRQVPLWHSPGGPMSGSKTVARVVSGFPVRIVETKHVGAQQWTRCYTYHFTPASFVWVASHMVRTERHGNLPENGG